MKAVRYHEAGKPDVLQVDEIDRPQPEKGEILVEVRAASINPVDAKRRRAGAGRLPKTTGSDFAGVVASVGAGVERFSVGDRVFGTGLHADRFQQGSFAEFVAVPQDIVAELPDGVSFSAGAATALVGVTAWRALVDHARLQPAEACLVHGGSGGVGHVAVQLADAIGATVAATAGSAEKQTYVRNAGADVVLSYNDESLSEMVVGALEGGADVIVDHRVDEYLQFDVDVAAFGGRIVVYGGLEGALPDARAPRSKELSMYWMSMTNIANREGTLAPISSILSKIAILVEQGDIAVEIADVYELEDAIEMHREVMNGDFIGKIVAEL